MATFDNQRMPQVKNASPTRNPPQGGHQRSKSSVLRSFMHRRNNSDGSGLPQAELASTTNRGQGELPTPDFSRPNALGEIQHNQVDSAPRSPTKSAFSSISKFSPHKKENASSTKPKKIKSSTNLGGLLSRPKSLRNLHKLASEDEINSRHNKENNAPDAKPSQEEFVRPPIYAQFSSGALESPLSNKDEYDPFRPHGSVSSGALTAGRAKERPKSYQPHYTPRNDSQRSTATDDSTKSSPSKGVPRPRAAERDAYDRKLDPKEIEKHLEALLDRRNIPENQRYKMRNLADTIKMEFIRQDWAESSGTSQPRPSSHDSDSSMSGSREEERPKRTRGRSFTLSRNAAKRSEASSPTKKQKGEGTIGRHFRSRSTDSVASERPSSSSSNSGGGIFSKIKLQQGPADYVNYLRKVQRPETVEVGKLHKLRLLLRNETVAWIEEFIRQGGMQEIVGLLHRIMEVEWREEHEDALLHENLLCLKALCTTALALQYLHSIQATLFPALVHMLFDPEKKGPSEFTTRNIITSVLFTYIESAPLHDRPVRAKTVLGHLRDPEPKENERPVEFVLEMRRERPYRMWCKEVTSVTKEVFWIFLHHLNVVSLPRDSSQTQSGFSLGAPELPGSVYMKAHFPQERPPVPAAPYVGGVEWDATNYLTSHMDLLNAILACTPTAEERNSLRHLLQISGFERCMGGSLRLCKEKFYPGVHDAMRTWVSAAHEDRWDVRDVRYGPPAETKSPRKYPGAFGGGNNNGKDKPKQPEAPPKIEMPKLDFGGSAVAGAEKRTKQDGWLS